MTNASLSSLCGKLHVMNIFLREFSPTHCMLFLTVYSVNFFSRCKSSSWNKFFLINDFSVWYCPLWFSQLTQHYLTHNFKIRMTLKLYFPKELIRSQSSGFTFCKSITNRLWTSCFLLNYLKVKIKQHIVIEMGESSFVHQPHLIIFIIQLTEDFPGN